MIIHQGAAALRVPRDGVRGTPSYHFNWSLYDNEFCQQLFSINRHLITSAHGVWGPKQSKGRGFWLGWVRLVAAFNAEVISPPPHNKLINATLISVIKKSYLFNLFNKGSVGELICDYCNETGFDTVNILSVHVRVHYYLFQPNSYFNSNSTKHE